MSASRTPITPQESTIVLIDHQPGVMSMVGSLPVETVASNVALLARLGEHTEIPLVVTTTRETVEYIGNSIEEIQTQAPRAYEARIARDGYLDAFSDQAFVDAVSSAGRNRLIMAGILTDVCLWHSAVSALDRGYEVTLVADANGTTTPLADQVTYDRLRDRGAEVSTAFGTLFELYPDFGTPEGERAEAIASGQALTEA